MDFAVPPDPQHPVFHAGERAMQRATGAEARLREVGPRVIRDHMPDQHRAFFAQLPSLVVGSVDAGQRPWASVLVGRPGFVGSPDARRLRVDALPFEGDPLRRNLREGATLGLLGLEPQTRRRNRVNGTLVAVDANGFDLDVVQSFGNCPKYIQTRTPRWVDADPSPPAKPQREGPRLSDAAAGLVAGADTLFIASSAAGEGADVSHRGGRAGFVRVEQAAAGSVLTLPDFPGNFFFNTLGNIALWPWAGLLFVDHERGGVLQLTGRAAVIESGPEVDAFEGAERLLRVEVEDGCWTPAALPLRWSAPGFAAQLAATGRW